MDFAEALSVLQSRTTAPLPPEHGGRSMDVDGSALDISTAPTSLQQCATCDEEAQQDGVQQQAEIPSDLRQLGVGGLLRLFFERQEARVAIYRRFEDGFVLFLKVAEATGYEALVASTTASFSEISGSVNKIEAELRERGGPAVALAATLRAVQLLEKEKLQITAQLQILRHGIAIDEVQRESEEDAQALAASRTHALRSEEAAGLQQRLDEITVAIGEALDELRCELVDGDMDDEQEREEPET